MKSCVCATSDPVPSPDVPQGMDTSLGGMKVSPATVSVLDSISVLIWVPLCECPGGNRWRLHSRRVPRGPKPACLIPASSCMPSTAADDLVIDPFFAKRGKPISRLMRIGIGYVVAIAAMVTAAVVEIVRLNVVDSHGLQDVDPTADDAPTVPMSVWCVPPAAAREAGCGVAPADLTPGPAVGATFPRVWTGAAPLLLLPAGGKSLSTS